MTEFNINRTLDFTVPESDRATELIRLFGLRESRVRQRLLTHTLRIATRPGDIVYITGTSGSGKSVLLNAMLEQVPATDRLCLDQIEVPIDRPVIDCINGSVLSAAETLSKAGLGEVFCMLQPPGHLSTGQQHRYRLAKAISGPAAYIFADEFTGSLDRIAALALGWHLNKLAARSGKVFILASCHQDILAELRPDILIIKSLNGTIKTLYKDDKRDPNPQRVGVFKMKKYPF